MIVSGRLVNGAITFVTVVEAGSFRAAARVLEITPSGISRAVARLEEQLSVRLFNRHARALVLTEEGQRFYDEVHSLIAGIGRAADDLHEGSERVAGRLRIQACPPTGHNILAPNIGAFLERHPHLSAEIEVRDRLGDLVADSFDVAIRFGDPEATSATIRKLAETEVLTCASPAYLERFGTPSTPRELLDPGHRCIDFRFPNSARLAEWDFLIDGAWQTLPVKSRMVVSDAPSLLAACISGYGIAQPLALYSRDALRSGALVRLLPEWNQERFPLFAYLPPRRHPPAKVRLFLSFVESLIGVDEARDDKGTASSVAPG